MKKLLDIGCGPGGINNIGYYKKLEKEYKIFGIDISTKNIKLIKKRFPNGIFTVGSAEKIPYAKNYFDGIILRHVLEHVINLEKTLSELKRVSKKNALLFIAVPDSRLEKRLNKLLPHYIEKGHHHARVFTKAFLTKKLLQYGFEVKKTTYEKWPMFIITVLFASLSRQSKKIEMEEQSGIFLIGNKNYLENRDFYKIYFGVELIMRITNRLFYFLNRYIPFELEAIAYKK